MLRLTEIRLPLDHPEDALRAAILKRLAIAAGDLRAFTVFRRAVDARKPAIVFIYTLDVEVRNERRVLKRLQGDRHVARRRTWTYRFPARAPGGLATRPVVIGTGPCGLFAGLLLAQMGFRPIILERGKVVRERTKDTWGLWRKSVLNPESNVQFGEGGAGTFSDGKLYSQIKDPRHLGRKVLTEFVKAGAPPEILYVAKPHIGTFRLVTMVESMRATIEALGGEYRFQSQGRRTSTSPTTARAGCAASCSRAASASPPITSCSPSATARATRSRCSTSAASHIEAKPFSIGFRIEHPQSLIDRARFGDNAGHPLLGAADYKLVHHASNGRSVYSFCMCPGGTVVAAASEPGRVVTNGMSQYSRNERNANAGIVVGITPADYPGHPLAGIAFQRHWEERAFEAGGGNYCAPAQRVGDFLAGRPSTALGAVTPSYTPGVRRPISAPACPTTRSRRSARRCPPSSSRSRGFAMDDAVLTGVETRTSSPIRIRRGHDFQSLNTRGLYPAGEGAGYAGGILSAAIDGIEVAEAVALSIAAKTRLNRQGAKAAKAMMKTQDNACRSRSSRISESRHP